MNRPIYEVPQDVANELEVMEFLKTKWAYPVTYSKLPKFYQLEFGIYDATSKALLMICEIKTRDINRTTYPDLILSAHKMHALIDWHNRGIHARLFYRLNDGLFFYRVTDKTYQLPCREGGRKDRNDWQDIEPVYHIPTFDLIGLSQWKST